MKGNSRFYDIDDAQAPQKNFVFVMLATLVLIFVFIFVIFITR